MKPEWDKTVSQLENAVSKWARQESNLPPTLSANAGIQIPKESIGEALSGLSSHLKAINARVDVDPIIIGLHQSTIQTSVQRLEQYLDKITPGSAQIQGLVDCLGSIRSALIWFPPTAKQVIEPLANDLSIVETILRLLDSGKEIIANEKKISETVQNLSTETKQIQKIHEQIKGYERESSTAKTNAQASASTAAADQIKIAENFKKLSEFEKKLTELVSKIEALQNQAEVALQGACQVGLARSFAKNHKQSVITQLVWGCIFGIGILSLSILEYETLSMLSHSNYLGILIHAAAGLPVVWLTWFSALQYGRTVRLAEDYSFKEASALAFYGYQREMAADQQMTALLRAAAIRTFGENPIRVLEKDDTASPLHHFLNKKLAKASLPQICEIISLLKNESK